MKGQAQHTFIFIFAIIVAALIMVWGVKTILDLKDRAGQVELADAVQDIENKAITYLSLSSGSQDTKFNVPFPKEIECVCLVDRLSGTTSFIGIEGDLSAYNDYCDKQDKALKSRIQSTNSQNIFVTPSSLEFSVKEFRVLRKLIPQESLGTILCFKTRKEAGWLKAVITSQGGNVTLAPQP